MCMSIIGGFCAPAPVARSRCVAARLHPVDSRGKFGEPLLHSGVQLGSQLLEAGLKAQSVVLVERAQVTARRLVNPVEEIDHLVDDLFPKRS